MQSFTVCVVIGVSTVISLFYLFLSVYFVYFFTFRFFFICVPCVRFS